MVGVFNRRWVQVVWDGRERLSTTTATRDLKRVGNARRRVRRVATRERSRRSRLKEAVRELLYTLGDVLECGDLRGHLAAWWDVVAGRVDVDGPALAACTSGRVIFDEQGEPCHTYLGPGVRCPLCGAMGTRSLTGGCVPAWERQGAGRLRRARGLRWAGLLARARR